MVIAKNEGAKVYFQYIFTLELSNRHQGEKTAAKEYRSHSLDLYHNVPNYEENGFRDPELVSWYRYLFCLEENLQLRLHHLQSLFLYELYA